MKGQIGSEVLYLFDIRATNSGRRVYLKKNMVSQRMVCRKGHRYAKRVIRPCELYDDGLPRENLHSRDGKVLASAFAGLCSVGTKGSPKQKLLGMRRIRSKRPDSVPKRHASCIYDLIPLHMALQIGSTMYYTPCTNPTLFEPSGRLI